MLAGFAKAGAELATLDFFVHGTTLGINALLTRTGARVAIVTTTGFRDVYEVGRTDCEPMYDFKYRRPRRSCHDASCSRSASASRYSGECSLRSIASALTAARRIREQGVEAVAVCFLHSYATPRTSSRWSRSCGPNAPTCPSRSRTG